LMERFFVPVPNGPRDRWFTARSNLVESDKEYEVSVDLPGMKPEDFNVELRQGDLWITGQRKCETLTEGKNYRRIGCTYGSFQEIIPLEAPVKADKIDAEYKDGVLRVTVPKDESAQSHRIEVKSS